MIQFRPDLLVPYAACGNGICVPMAMLPDLLLIGTNFAVLVDALRSGYVACNSTRGPRVFTMKSCFMISSEISKTVVSSPPTPAFAMTTSRRPAMRLISSTAARLFASSAEISLTTCSLCSSRPAISLRAVAVEGSRAPAKTMTSSRTTRCWTRAKPI
jgi:hypothetical protein